MKAPIPKAGPVDPLEWAHALRKREQLGERLSKAQRDMWRSALGRERKKPEQP